VKKKIFWKVYGVMVVIGVALSVTGFILFWNFLSAYEKSQPKHEMERVLELFEDGDSSQLVKYMTYELSALENDDTIIKYLDNMSMDGQWDFKQKPGAYSKDTPVYNVEKDGVTVATVTLVKSTEKANFKMDRWEMQSISDILKPLEDYVITAPNGATVYVNGTPLSKDYIKEKDIAITDLADSAKYVTVPTMVKYSVSGLYSKPEITAVGNVFNAKLSPSYQNTHNLKFAFESNLDFNKSQESRIVDITQIYGKYVYNDAKFASLSPFLIANSDSYNSLKTIASVNIWYGNHTLPEFEDLIVSNYQMYSTNCYSCDVSVTISFILSKKIFQYPTNLRYYFVKTNDEWRVADFEIK